MIIAQTPPLFLIAETINLELILSNSERDSSRDCRGLLSAGGPAVLEVCDESRSLGRSPCALTARCPTVISVSVHSISGALTFTARANSTRPLLSLCGGFPPSLVTATGKSRAHLKQFREEINKRRWTSKQGNWPVGADECKGLYISIYHI